MLKNSFLGLILVAALSACSPTKTIVVTPPTNTKPADKVVPVKPVSKVTWSIDVPKDWEKKTQSDPTELHDVKRVLTATKTITVKGVETDIMVTVTMGHISREEAAGFPANILDIEHNRRNAKVLDARPIELGDKVEGVELAELRQIDAHSLIALLIVAGAKEDVGVLAACGAPVQAAEEALPLCGEIVQSLRIK
jgi:hypothetical protein